MHRQPPVFNLSAGLRALTNAPKNTGLASQGITHVSAHRPRVLERLKNDGVESVDGREMAGANLVSRSDLFCIAAEPGEYAGQLISAQKPAPADRLTCGARGEDGRTRRRKLAPASRRQFCLATP